MGQTDIDYIYIFGYIIKYINIKAQLRGVWEGLKAKAQDLIAHKVKFIKIMLCMFYLRQCGCI